MMMTTMMTLLSTPSPPPPPAPILLLQGIEFHDELAALEEQFGAPKGAPGQWAGCLRLVDPATLSTAYVTELDNNEAVVSMALADLAMSGGGGAGGASAPPERMLVVGCAQGLRYMPTDCDGEAGDGGGCARVCGGEGGRRVAGNGWVEGGV